MSRHELVGRFHGSTPGVYQVLPAPDLPPDVLREASRRLAIMALVAGSLWFLATVLGHLAFRQMYPGDERWLQFGTPEWVSAIAIVVSFAVFFYARRPGRNPAGVLDLGLLYMIVTALLIALMTFLEPYPGDLPIHPMITWSGAAILIFASILPSPPAKTALAAFVAASMGPLFMLVAKARGTWDFGPPIKVLVMYYPDYLLAGVSVVISIVVTRLGREVKRAREMGSYQIGELLGSGGMGEVYRATHRMLARPAAIKLIRPGALGATDSRSAELAIQRFRREAEVAASLRSPHTVELYDFGVTEDRTFYMVMEFLVGLDLESLVARAGPLPADRVIFILRQVCASLEEAHQAGLVHRDIKPANIHVGRLGLQHDFVKVLDFGLVKSIDRAGSAVSLETSLGMTPGTPAYMAPELARGDSYDGRADLYALGCTAYYLLTGQLVFEGTSALDIIMKHQAETPARPSKRGPRLVPGALEDLVLACLDKVPDRRPATAAELAHRLHALPYQSWGEDEARRWWQAHAAAV